MDSSEFPPNSETSKKIGEEKDVTRVTSGDVTRKKRSLRKQFSETFVAGDAKSAIRYAAMEVLLPAAKDMVVEIVQGFVEKLIYGDRRRYRGATPPQSGPTGYVSYNRITGPMASRMSSSAQRVMSRQARARHNFDEIILAERAEAEEVIDRLFDLVSRYESASVADLYELVGLESSHTDNKWGWTDVRGSGVTRTRDGYLLDLPEPQPLD
jgi:hypothetical protein